METNPFPSHRGLIVGRHRTATRSTFPTFCPSIESPVPDVHLTVIAKTPVAGRVKTRLCPPLSFEQAADIAAAALTDTMVALDRWASSAHVDRQVVLLDGEPGDWIGPRWDVVAQSSGDLGERLAAGFDELGPGVIVGMDTPSAVRRWTGVAVDAIADGHDALGLAVDGGYWVIGLARPNRAVFDNVPMSVSNTGIAQLRQLHQSGRSVRLLPMTRDLDTIDDLRSLAASEDRADSGAFGAVIDDVLRQLR
jgi:uncharacterized protein